MITEVAAVSSIDTHKKRLHCLCFQLGNRGTISQASDFNADADVEKLRAAMKGTGEETKKNTLCPHIVVQSSNLTPIKVNSSCFGN